MSTGWHFKTFEISTALSQATSLEFFTHLLTVVLSLPSCFANSTWLISLSFKSLDRLAIVFSWCIFSIIFNLCLFANFIVILAIYAIGKILQEVSINYIMSCI